MEATIEYITKVPPSAFFENNILFLSSGIRTKQEVDYPYSQTRAYLMAVPPKNKSVCL